MTIDSLSDLFIKPNWPAPNTVKAYSSLRKSNLGNVLETPQNGRKPNSVGNNVLETPQNGRKPNTANRDRLKTLLQLPTEPIWLNQTHSTIALPATPVHTGQEGDASFTHESNQVCAVLTADCLPLLLCNQAGTFAAAIHAGWRGLANGVIENTLQAAQVPSDELLVWLGPAIGPNKFEVRQDVFDAFTQNDPDSKKAFHQISEQQWLADLYALARLRLQRKGITHIFGGDYCTFSDSERFYSYRRDKGIKDRLIHLIWIANSD